MLRRAFPFPPCEFDNTIRLNPCRWRERHMMLRESEPHRGQNQGRLASFRQSLGGPNRYRFTDRSVRLDRQMRSVLFDGGNRENDDRIVLCRIAQLISPQLAPFDLHHLRPLA
jgi:hypothetical protein